MKPRQAFWALVRLSPGLYLRDLVLQLFRCLTQLLPGLVVYELFNQLSGKNPVNRDLWSLSALLVGFTVARVTFLLLSVRVDATIESASSSALMRNVLASSLAKPGAVPSRYAAGDMVSRLSVDTTAVSEALVTSLMVIGVAAQAVLAITLMFIIDPVITAVVFVPLAATSALINMASTRIKNYHRQSRQAAAEVSGFLGDTFSNILAIQAAGAQPHIMARFSDVNEQRRKRTLQSRLFTNVFMVSVWTNMSNIGVGFILILAAQSMKEGSFTVGDLALFAIYLGWISDFTSLFSQNLALYKQAVVSLQRLAEALPDGHSLPDLVSPALGPAGASHSPAARDQLARQELHSLEVKDLIYTYPSGRGITGVSFRLERESFVVVTGRMGAGKTTLLRALLGLLPMQSGEIYWNGEAVRNPAEFFIPPHSAYTPQVPRLVSDGLQENILMGLPADPAHLDSAIRLAVLETDVEHLDQGLATLLGPRGTKLSGGQAHRAAAARMFVRRPELLVFDDLSSALDVRTEAELWQRTSDLAGQTCLVVSHRRAAFERATHIIVLKDGRIEAQGPLDDIFDSSPELHYLWATEIGTEGGEDDKHAPATSNSQ